MSQRLFFQTFFMSKLNICRLITVKLILLTKIYIIIKDYSLPLPFLHELSLKCNILRGKRKYFSTTYKIVNDPGIQKFTLYIFETSFNLLINFLLSLFQLNIKEKGLHSDHESNLKKNQGPMLPNKNASIFCSELNLLAYHTNTIIQ